MPTSKRGKFIVFEGLDGSGQSTQVELLTNFLKSKAVPVVKTKEPTQHSPVSAKIRKVLSKEAQTNPQNLQELFCQDRAWHLENVVAPALEQNKIVISDRYYFSSFAFGKAAGVSEAWLLRKNEKLLLPDIVFFLEVSPEISLERIKRRGKPMELFEKKEKLEKVAQNYLYFLTKFKDKTKIYFLKGEQTIEQIFKEIKTICQKTQNQK